MCWVGKCDVKIAKRDFYVYKLGCISDEGFHSLYQNFIYVPGVINKKVKMPVDKVNLLFVGRFDPQKGVDFLLKV